MRYRFLFYLAFLLLTSLQLQAQRDMIITRTDTISNVKVLKSEKKTNAQWVTFKANGSKQRLLAKQIKKMYASDELYISKAVKNLGQEPTLMKYIFEGEVGIYSSFRNFDGKMRETYFLSSASGDFYDLSEYQDVLENFFDLQLKDFSKFMEGYERKIKFGYVSLATMISHYNHFRFPGKYEAVKFKPRNSEKIIYALAGAAIAGYLISKVVKEEEPTLPFSVSR